MKATGKSKAGSDAVVGLPPSPAYRAFLQFVAHACGGAPVQGYPAVLVVLASVPLSVSACFFIVALVGCVALRAYIFSDSPIL